MKPARHTRRVPPSRDQDVTAFTAILARLLDRLPGASAAALVDQEGEAVDYAGFLKPFDMKLVAAHFRVVIDELRERPALRSATYLLLRTKRSSYQVHVLPEGYALVVVLARAAGFSPWRRAISACSLELAREAAWPHRGLLGVHRWYAARVAIDERRRPAALLLGSRPYAIEVLGAVATPSPSRERGWRIRVESGVETTLVREAGGAWYVDDPAALEPPLARAPTKSR